MQGYNVLVIYNKDMSKLLMCKRTKDPYMGLSNLVGGKIEPNEAGIDAAYRELFEETNITIDDIKLRHLMDFKYYYQKCYVEVYVGKLKHDMEVSGDENELYWSSLDKDFFDMSLYAGEGNIGHMIEQVEMCKEELFIE